MPNTDTAVPPSSDSNRRGTGRGVSLSFSRALWFAIAAACGLASCLWMWGYTVDDALIPIRYARHLRAGLGYRFNADAAVTDGVTPLPWAFLLAPFANAEPLVVLLRARVAGLFVWTVAVAAWGYEVGKIQTKWWLRGLAIVLLALSIPASANAVSGMETSFAMALTAFATIANASTGRAFFAGFACAFRPELLGWTTAISMGETLGKTRGQIGKIVLAGFGPFAICVLLRVAVFGRPAPLAVWAKPSDMSLGLSYALAGLVVSIAPLTIFAPFAVRHVSRRTKVLVAALVLHTLTVIAVGGDWMAFSRLFAPVIAPTLFAGLEMARVAPKASALRFGLAFTIALMLFVHNGSRGRSVAEERARLIEAARPYLATKRVAAVDIGWVSAATDNTIVDLAGLTDPSIAILRGSHTSKNVDPVMLLDRKPEILLLYARNGQSAESLSVWPAWKYAYAIDQRFARNGLIQSHFVPRTFIPLGPDGAGYVVLEYVQTETEN